ncbi:oligoribonuclease [Salpingoeca rosetta]|uniref:Oligoribonuclease n=1 Tax=Salpingoeca rosetta (strain ATCC 50818 / BSB-021) TaxID=946362 RepID=F2U819_SALR5|nr:oligoribonuclease [Salpingoeca rosetta]EGD72924.1 oligoribonuclease [Salpingoeca rosetta]|eukprot:XP_004994746.1 oligoribonuclease [Salpingoeca rosetta]
MFVAFAVAWRAVLARAKERVQSIVAEAADAGSRIAAIMSSRKKQQRERKQRQQREEAERARRMVWVDLEMSGLDVSRERILEMAMIITDADLNVVASSGTVVLHQPEHILESMDEWNTTHHTQSGLVERVRQSKLREWDVEDQMLKLLHEHCPEKRCPLAGSSVHVDRLFLLKYMPRFTDYLHYRIIDVSSVLELSRRWNKPVLDSMPAGRDRHRAEDDIVDTIEKLKHFKEHFFITK